jgi:hypothetical protein
MRSIVAYLNLSVDGTLLIVQLIVIVGVHLQVVEGELLLDALLESQALFEGEGIGLGDDGDDIDDIGQLLQDNDIDGLETEQCRDSVSTGSQINGSSLLAEQAGQDSRMAGGLDEEQAAVDTGILDIALTLSSKLLAKVCGVLILDVLDNRVPASATSVSNL